MNTENTNRAEEYLNEKGITDSDFMDSGMTAYISQLLTNFHASQLEEITEEMEGMKDNTGQEGCTYGDTDFDSQAVVYGFNVAIDYISKWLLQKLKQQ